MAAPGEPEVVRVGRFHAEHLAGGIVTAYNPLSRPHHESGNRESDRRLEARLGAAGGRLLRTLAIPDDPAAGEWREPGFLVRDLPLEKLVDMAAEFGQNAIVWLPAAAPAVLVCCRDGFAGCRAGEEIPTTESDDARS